jgi:hypothetical protein
MRIAAFALLGTLALSVAPLRADDVTRIQPRILAVTKRIMEAADTVKERQVNLESKFKYLVKTITGDRRNLYIRFHGETQSLHGRARDLDANRILDRVGLQKTKLEKEIAFFQAYDVVRATTAQVERELRERSTDPIAKRVYYSDLKPALNQLQGLLPGLDAYAGYRLQRHGSRSRLR